MTNKQIEDFFVNNKAINRTVKIAFKSRNPVEGIFIETRDYDELKSKNFWRIVSNTHVDNYKKTKDINLSRIFNGSEITKLSCI
ncbi:MAG TPA: hypothetical protein VKR53_01825 [Puia sp.]|jgi:hypothetical protein|nr:hypothetical protein [Puia sp.]HSZ87323.1 hypothetical protein [Puia sp.]